MNEVRKMGLKILMSRYLTEFIKEEMDRCLRNVLINEKCGTDFKYELNTELMRTICISKFYDEYERLATFTYYRIMDNCPVLSTRYESIYQELTYEELEKIYVYLKCLQEDE